MVDLDIMAACCLITPTNISSGDNLRLRADIVVILYLNCQRLRIEMSGLSTFSSKMPSFPTIKTPMPPFRWVKICASNVPIT